MAEGGLGLSLPTIDEPDVDPSGQDTDARLQGIVKEKERLTARLKRLNSSLDEIQAEETDIVGDDMTELVAELGEDSDLKQILDTIKLSAEEISSVEDSIRQIAAEGEELERQGVDFRQRYGAERRVTKGMELILTSQQVRGCGGWRMRGGGEAGATGSPPNLCLIGRLWGTERAGPGERTHPRAARFHSGYSRAAAHRDASGH